MNLFHRSTLAGLSLLVACTTQSQQSQNPDAAKYDGYYSERPGGAGGGDGDGSGNAGQVRTSTSSRGLPRKTGKARELVAKKPPVDGGEKPRTPHKRPATADPVVFDGFLPTVASAGSVVEIYGAGLDRKGLSVILGGKRAKILEAAADRVLIEVPQGASGPLMLSFPQRGMKGAPKNVAIPRMKSKTKFTPLKDNGGFGQARKNPGHGLVGSVYDLGGEVGELPAFGDLGDPVAVIAVDDLDIPSMEFDQSMGGPTEWFGIHFRGSLNITESGEYDLCLASGDGAQLYLDEQLIVNNDGVHDTAEVCEPVFAEPGEYQVDILYFQAAKGELGLTLSWAKDGGAKEPVPSKHLFPPADADAMAKK